MTSREPAALAPAVIQYWDREAIPDYVAELMAGFERLNPDLRHLVFDELSAEELIGERFGARQAAAFRACAVPAMQADYFRYCALHALGGVYADSDFRCVAPLQPLLEGPASGALFGRPELPARWRTPAFEWRERVGPYRVVMNSFFAFPSPGHPLLELAVEIATANVENRVAEDVALVTGPAIFTSLYLLRELGSFEAFVEYCEGGVLAPCAHLLCETVGEHERVVRAFDGVELKSEIESRAWVGDSGDRLPYKDTEDHWLNVTSSIYNR
jgi:hypothetical protein